MAVRSKDFVCIAEDIRSNELSAKLKIENIKGQLSELSVKKSELKDSVSCLEAEIAAGEGNISELLSRKADAERQLREVDCNIERAKETLKNEKSELDSVKEEKAQTLLEIRNRAKKTAQNISTAGGILGDYSSVGDVLKSSMQDSLSALTKAANILGGTVPSAQRAGSPEGVKTQKNEVQPMAEQPAPTGFKARARNFFASLIGEDSKSAQNTEDISEISSIEQLLSGSCGTLKDRFDRLKNIPVKSLTKQNLEELVSIVKSNLISKYGSMVKPERFTGLENKIAFLSLEEVKKDLGIHYNPHICGYYWPHTDTIKINMAGNSTVGDIISTIDHEVMHMLSNSPETAGSRGSGVRSNDIIYGNVGMNEGITELLSIKNMQAINPSHVSYCYVEEVKVMREFESICGAEKLLDAYLHNDLSVLRTEYEKYMGAGSFKKLCDDIDMMHHYRHSGSAGTTEAADIVRSVKGRIYRNLEKYKKAKFGY